MAKTLVIDYSKCHGCGECETACAMVGRMKRDISKPRIQSVIWDLIGRGVPITCQQCQDPPCMAVCPKHAIYRDSELNL